MLKPTSVAALTCVLYLAAACGGRDGDSSVDASPTSDAVLPDAGPTYGDADWLFEPDRILDVEINLPAADWDTVRLQTRNPMSALVCGQPPAASPFTFVAATVRIEGRELTQVGVRKKGFFGSADAIRPSLILDFDRFVHGQTLTGLKKMTLNNNRQDPGNVNQCLGYGVFAAAGVPAPRCNFARVRVNGQDLGVYTHVEAVGKPMLGRHFADNSGNLYEGALSDFRPGWTATFDRKTNEGDPDRSDLQAIADALAIADDAAMATAVESLIDLDGFFRFMAAEVLTVHIDGYGGNSNNFFLYRDPATGKFSFMPWGNDGSFIDGFPTDPAFTRSLLARRLYAYPATRARYLTIYQHILDEVWDDAAMTAEVDRMSAMLTPHVRPSDLAAFNARITSLGTFFDGREARYRASLAMAGPGDLDDLMPPLCFNQVGTFTGSFTAVFTEIGSDVTAAMNIGGPYPLTALANLAAPNDTVPGRTNYIIRGTDSSNNTVLLFVTWPTTAAVPGTVDLGGTGVETTLVILPAAGGPPLAVYFIDGTLQLEAAAPIAGAPWRGTIDATIWSL